MTLPVTAFVAAICAQMLLFTAIDTVWQRLRLKAAFGDAGDSRLVSASRSHGNLAEHAPIVVLLIAFLEMSRANHIGLMIVGAGFLLARVAHIIGLHTIGAPGKPPVARQIGVIGTWLTLLLLSAWTLLLLATGNIG